MHRGASCIGVVLFARSRWVMLLRVVAIFSGAVVRNDGLTLTEALAYPDPIGLQEGHIPCSLQLINQTSKAKCVANISFGCVSDREHHAVWVTEGCRGEFICNGRVLNCSHGATCSCTQVLSLPCPCQSRTWQGLTPVAPLPLPVPVVVLPTLLVGDDWAATDADTLAKAVAAAAELQAVAAARSSDGRMSPTR